MHEFYFDYAATTPLLPEVKNVMRPYEGELFANPSSAHKAGQRALAAFDSTRETVARLIHVENEKDIIFTSCATESNNMALKGVAYDYFLNHKKPAHMVSSSIDHPSVIETLRDLEKQRIIEVTCIDPGKNGYMHPQSIADAIRKETILVSVHHVNSETGNIQPIAEITKAVKEKNKNCFVHADASQSPLSEQVSVKELGVDALTLSSHKIYGPKGAALLYKKPSMHMTRLISGSDQEDGFRAGTENMSAIVGFCKALEIATTRQKEIKEKFFTLQNILRKELNTQKIKYEVNGDIGAQSPKIISLFFPAKIAQEVLVFLDSKNIFISAGSACKARAPIPSESVYRIYNDRMRALHSVRISFGYETSYYHIGILVNALKEIL